ncbi:substrate-binding domain-containing protein [Herpetosiphon llansteffanensis]|uniref:substrate-binding domain-containing protein n=1 Tax=Herpetosiphon llansteffanensis TaxID=2094568 RepID=UPI000D7C67F6|nr:substrate-binding domain-containing protein [Herpetosiphon llansteffanensis]
MRKAWVVAVGFFIICAFVVGAVSNGWLDSSAPLAILPTRMPSTPDPSQAIKLQVVYSSEKDIWLKQTVNTWLATKPTVDGKPIQVELIARGSQEIVSQLQAGSLRPTAISPASSLQITQINAAQIDGKTNLAADTQPLLISPLVLVAYEGSPASKLVKSQDAQFWQALHDGVLLPQRSQKILLGQTSPTTSNSGFQAWVLMAYAYHNKANGLTAADISDPKFVEWLQGYAKNVEQFAESTGSLMLKMVQVGPSTYGAAVVYESTALEYLPKAQGRFGKLMLLYPPQNLYSDHPLAILDASWSSVDQREAAGLLREFLLEKDQQTMAVQQGFRPVDPDVAIDTADSPFVKYQSAGVQLSIANLAAEPDAATIKAVLDLWNSIEPSVKR